VAQQTGPRPDDREPEEWDVAVAGAGPAGAVAALAVLDAWPGARVVLLDRQDFPRDKTCGDGLAAQILDVLAEVGEPALLDDWPRVHRLRLHFPDGAGVAGTMARPTLVVPREVLDARLVEAAVKRGAVLRRHRVRQVRPLASGGVLVDDALRARVLIGADGAHSAVRTSLRLPPPRPGTTAIALRGYAPVHPDRAEEQVIAFAGHAAWPAYAWSFPIGDGRANVGYGEALPVGGPGPSRARMQEQLEVLLPGSTEGITGLKAYHLPLSTGRLRQPDGPVLLVGDALGLVNPLTGEGIHAAVRSGAVAGAVAARTARAGAGATDGAGAGGGQRAGREYRRALSRAMGAHLRQMDLVARLAADPRVVRVGLEVSAADRRVFHALVDLGLADGRLTPHLVLALIRRAGVAGLAETLRSARRSARRAGRSGRSGRPA
jgi:geranylgeranyl reductase family protein